MKEISIHEEGIRVQAEIIAKRTKEHSWEANDQLLASIAHAEKAEQQSVEKIIEAEKWIQRTMENAVQLLEQKFMDVMKQIEGSTGTQQ